MIWLSWRQFRTPLLTALGALAVAAAGLVVLGVAMRHSYDSTIVGCAAINSCERATDDFTDTYGNISNLLSLALLVLPALLGAFWGAPLVARELETGTHRLAWTQSITRRHWLAVKLGLVALTGVVVVGVFTLVLTWAVDPVDTMTGNRFTALQFGARNLAPMGYAVFALVLGATIGLLLKRTLPTMAVLIVAFAVLQLGIVFGVRSHLLQPVTESVPVTVQSMEMVHSLTLQGRPPDGGTFDPDTRVVVGEIEKPGAWMLTSYTDLLRADGTRITPEQAEQCFQGGGPKTAHACLAKQDLHFDISYQPSSRYWPFQGIETGAFLLAALLLAGYGLWRIPRGVAA